MRVIELSIGQGAFGVRGSSGPLKVMWVGEAVTPHSELVTNLLVLENPHFFKAFFELLLLELFFTSRCCILEINKYRIQIYETINLEDDPSFPCRDYLVPGEVKAQMNLMMNFHY